MAFGGSTNTNIMSDETFDLLCRVCKRKGRNQEAEKYCMECQDYFCLTCVKVHEDIPSLTGHKILDKSQFSSRTSKKLAKGPQASSPGQPAAPTERCDKHSHYYIDTYCQNHDEVGCATCMAVDHRSCKDIFYIPEFIKNNPTASAHGDVKNKLDSIATSLKVHHERLQREKGQLLKRKAEVLQKIKKFRQEINDRLDELEKNSIADIEDRYKTLISQIEEGMKMLDANRASVKSAQDKVRSSGSNVSQDFVNARKGKSIASNASQCIEHNTACIRTEDIEFTPEQRIPALLGEINMLGKITQRDLGPIQSTATSNVQSKMTRNPIQSTATSNVQSQMTRNPTQSTATSNVQSQMKRNQTDPATGNTQKTDALLQAKGSKKYDVKVKSDKSDCDIVSACSLEDGTIILSDNNNNKLKRLDSSTYTVTDYCDLPGDPWQVCAISNQEVAVCLLGKQAVQFISVGSRLKQTRQIKTDFICYGLAYAKGNLYISDHNTSVYIYSVSGSKLKQFSKNQPGQRLFSNILSLAVSKDGSKIYVSDRDKGVIVLDNNGLIVLDNNGQVVGQFNGSQLNSAWDCYLTDTGSLLVCGDYSNNVLQFGQNGEFRKVVLEFTDKRVHHKAICCNQQTSKMLIGRRDNEVEVYDLVKQST